MQLDICLDRPPSRVPGAGMIVDVACRNATVAQELRDIWSAQEIDSQSG
jgi:hypothetical protein